MVNLEQLTNSLTSSPHQLDFIRHAIFGLLAVLVSIVILHMQQQPHQNELSNPNPSNDSILVAFLLRLILNPVITAIATLLTTLWTFILRIVGTMLGVGLGLGLAGHIYDSLDDMYNQHKNKNADEKLRSASMTAKVPATPFATSEDPNSYHSLMRSAGYHVDPATLRAQMVRGERATVATKANGSRSEQHSVDSTGQHQKPSIYKFEKGETAYVRMKSMWPNLSPLINESLAKLTEFVLRDYVASWYGKVDENVAYVDPVSAPKESAAAPSSDLKGSATAKASPSNQNMMNGATKERRTTIANPLEITSFANNSSGSSVSAYSSRPPPPSPSLSKSMPIGSDEEQHNSNRTMVLTTVGTLPSPFIDSLYTSFAYLLGTLATRASENVNILELLLLHLPHVLGENLKVYRELRRAALEKKRRREGAAGTNRPGSKRGKDSPLWRQSSSINAASINGAVSPSAQHSSMSEDDVSEIAIIREYLLAGRFHRAVTFGLDVPSLLFADPLAKDCPPSGSYKEINERLNKSGNVEEDSVLEDRLLSSGSTLVAECELDYARVLASKIAKLVVPKSEIESSIVRSMLVEMLASCVLMPVMGCFAPDSVNGWIITGLQLALEDGESDTTTTESGTVSATNRSESAISLTETNQSLVCDGDMDEILEAALGTADNMSDVMLGEGSITSEVEDALFGDTDDASKSGYLVDQCAKSEQLVNLLSMSIIELRNFVDFDDCRYAKEHDQDIPVDWDHPRSREAVRHLVLIIEAALLLGSRPERRKAKVRGESINDISEFVEATLEEAVTMGSDEFEVDIDVVSESIVPVPSFHRHNSISAVLMEVTGDLDTFEKMASNADQMAQSSEDDSLQDPEANFTPKPHELSTLRTLIAAWLHTGQAYRVLSIIEKCHEAILRPFYYKNAFVRRENYFFEFTKLLKQLEGVEILVDTTAVLASQCLLAAGSGFENFERKLVDTIHREGAPKVIMVDEKIGNEYQGAVLGSGLFKQVGSVRANFVQNRDRLARLAQESFQFGGQKLDFDDQSKSSSHSAYNYHHNSTPIYLQYTKNRVFASSLRTERQRRKESWHKETVEREKLDLVSRSKGVTEKDTLMHRELHHLSRFFYSNTSEINVEPIKEAGTQSESAANVTVKAIAPRRKIEVPDEDSSFLLRAQPRPLKPAAIHRDQKVANLACKIYVAMYEEPVMHPKTKRFYGGRYLRQCLLRYFPNDKTASVSIANDLTVFDRRVSQPNVKHILTEEFQKTRHSCMKVATSGSLLASPTMDPNDFCAFPRAGKALDFIFRMSFFERPVVELSGKKFVVHDASALLHHRADASCMELSDASLTAAIILRGSSGLNICYDENSTLRSFSIKISDDGSPLVLLRANTPGKEQSTKDEARPYRPSFIRAALLVKSAKQEAQAQCLSFCIKNGSARSSTKIKSDAWLQPTLNLLHYANSRRKEEQSAFLRDLHIGMNHVDRAQLCRNGLLNPRYPTVLRGLTVKVVGAVEVKAPTNVDLLGTPTLILFKIHCTAITEFIGDDDDDFSSGDGSGSKSRYFREEWTVLRSLRDFSIFHKHIKSQVAPTEHSAGAGARLVGAATAALTIVGGSQVGVKKERGQLVPSLSKATQAGTLGLSSKRVIERRKKLLDDYLKYLVAPNNLLSRCPELLNFLGAYTSIFPLGAGDGLDDEFGREDVSRAELDTEKLKVGIVAVKLGTEQKRPDATPKLTNRRAATSVNSQRCDSPMSETPPEPPRNMPPESPEVTSKKQTDVTRRIAMIRSQEVCLKDVRRSAFRLLKNLFDLDSASFFRSRVISVIRTMSVALTNAQDFHLMLFRTHIKYMNGEWVSGWILYLIDMFWPNGIFYTSGPDLTEKEKADLKLNSKKMLEKAFPLQLKTVLGKHSDEGIDMLHEMLQNRLVLKSIAYMLLDLVWAEVFPELSDFVTGAASLEKEL